MPEPIKVKAQDLFAKTFSSLRREKAKAAIAFSLFFAVEFAFGLVDGLVERDIQYDLAVLDLGWSINASVAFLGYLAAYAIITVTLTRALLSVESPLGGDYGEADISAVIRGAAVSILSLIGIALGLIAFIIPGIILAARWIAVVPFALRPGASVFQSFGQSAALARYSTVGLAACFIAFNLPSFALALFEVSFQSGGALTWLLGLIFETSVSACSAVLTLHLAVTFFLHATNASAEIAEVFE